MAFVRKSPEDRKAEMEALHERLTAQVETLRNSDQWTAYLDYCRSFHRYSFGNLMLIFAQCPTASQVAGYKAWQAKGRQVRKGERGLRIFGTGTVRIRKADDDGPADDDARRRIFFPVSVFDIGQTDVMEGHEDVSTVAHVLTGQDPDGIYDRVCAVLTAQGVTVRSEDLHGSANGYTAHVGDDDGPLEVVICGSLAPAQRAKTALHEYAHVALGHLADDHAEYVQHRGRYEVEAEATSYVLAGLLGLDSSAYSTGYVATWQERAESDVLRETATRVLAAVHTMADALGLNASEV